MVLTEEIKYFQKRLEALHHHLRIEEKEDHIKDEELKTQKSNFLGYDCKKTNVIFKPIRLLFFNLLNKA